MNSLKKTVIESLHSSRVRCNSCLCRFILEYPVFWIVTGPCPLKTSYPCFDWLWASYRELKSAMNYKKNNMTWISSVWNMTFWRFFSRFRELLNDRPLTLNSYFLVVSILKGNMKGTGWAEMGFAYQCRLDAPLWRSSSSFQSSPWPFKIAIIFFFLTGTQTHKPTHTLTH